MAVWSALILFSLIMMLHIRPLYGVARTCLPPPCSFDAGGYSPACGPAYCDQTFTNNGVVLRVRKQPCCIAVLILVLIPLHRATICAGPPLV